MEVMEFAHGLVLDVYRLSERFPADEQYGLRSQVRRAATSIPMNIAEGRGRGSDKDFARFVRIAIGSATELEYGLRLCQDLGYVQVDAVSEALHTLHRTRKMLNGLLKALTPSTGR
jgi:four helix bundle protein